MSASKLTGGAKLNAKLVEIAARVKGSHKLRVGFLEGASYPATAGGHAEVTAAQAAFWLNYGTKTAPARPFFLDMIREKSDGWGESLGKILQGNDFNVDNAMLLMGEGIKDQLRDAIINMDSPALSPVTLMIRKMLINNPNLVVSGATVGEAAARVAAGESTSPASTKVGVYSGHMLHSVGSDYESS